MREPGAKKRVLVADDEAYIVHVVSLKLSNAGYEVIAAHDGEEAYELALELRPDLIITDYQMPYMSGLELCRLLQESPETARIPALMLTARGFSLDPSEVRRTGIVEVLSKPFSPRKVLSRVQELLHGEPMEWS